MKKRLIWSCVAFGLMVLFVLVGYVGQQHGWWEMELTGRGVFLTPVRQTEQIHDGFDPTILLSIENTEGSAAEPAPAEAPGPVAKKCPACGDTVGLRAFSCPHCGNADGVFSPLAKCPSCGELYDFDDPQCPHCAGRGK